ncbi:MAG: nitronate monooxygenase [Proteobacteria bacterium]|nr:nitronate monooxygenase [Pseudomonadota bacterium]MCP4922108.1 nitronate monooxygenase [Pseudomonadota bacterium]
MSLHTPICDLFGVRYPIVQTGMGWVSGSRLTAATSKAGGLGILAAATLDYGELETAIGEIKAETDNPFGVNLRADQPDIDARLDLLIREGVKVASFARAPGKGAIARLKEAGLVTMPTIGLQKHARKVQEWGVDALIAQGGEGGGHTGSVPTSLLLPQVCESVQVPVLGAGGFRDGRGLVAALALGASGIAMGTRFLLTQESSVPEHIKAQYLKTPVTGTVVTTAIDGYPQRVVRTPIVQRLERSGPLGKLFASIGHALSFRALTGTPLGLMVREALAMKKGGRMTWSEVAMAANAPMLTRASMVEGNADVGILPTGQVVGLIDELPTVEQLLQSIVREAEDTLSALAQLHTEAA